jgi:flagellar hook-associated protein 1 FlgK
MALGGVLTRALSGMRTTQAGLDVVSQNVSNADSIGYVRRSANIVEQSYGSRAGTARAASIERILDGVVQRQLWNERSGAGFTSARSDYAQALDQLYGAPDSPNSLSGTFNRFSQSLQELKGDPANYSLRTNVLGAAQDLTARFQGLSGGIQELRSQAEAGLASGVQRVNELLTQLQAVNARVVSLGSNADVPALRDERDRVVTELAGYMDIRVTEGSNGSLAVFTNAGLQLFDGTRALTLTFDARPSLGPQATWNANDALRSVGTLRAVDQMGGSYDLIANRALRSGELAGLIELRDVTLVQAQTQLDELAASMASALSDREIAGTAVTVGPLTGFDVDVSGLSPGNQVTLDFTDPLGRARRVTLVRAESAATAASITAGGLGAADNQVIGVNFNQPMAGIAADIAAALAPGLAASTPGGTTLRVLSGPGGTPTALVSRPTVAGFATGQPELPFFTDGNTAGAVFTGSFEGRTQTQGFAARNSLNPDLLADRARLVQFATLPTTPQGDQTRPNLLFERLTASTRVFSPRTGIGGADQSMRSTVAAFAQRIVDDQGIRIEGAIRLDDGQQVALKSVEARFAEKSAVNVDREMADLVQLQAAYAANARVISAVKDMMDLLLRI